MIMTQADAQSASHSAVVRPAAIGGFALGLGLTNECNLACSFCYRDPARTDRLSLEQVRSVMESLPVLSVNLGTGENGMHPRFREILTDRKSTRLNSSHLVISYAVFCLKKKKKKYAYLTHIL